MRKYLSLILLLLLSNITSAFASNVTNGLNVGKAFSVSGGYVTSLNRFDGSFEKDTSNFTVSTGTLTKEASLEMEGSSRGSWEVNTSGTLDTVAQTITATDTYELSAIINSNDASNVEICANVNGSDNACKKILNKTGRQKASWIGQLNTGDSVKLRVKYIGTSGIHKVDNFKFDQYTAQIASLLIEEGVTYYGYTSGTTGGVLFATKNTSLSNESQLISAINSGSTRYTILANSSCKLSTAFDGNASSVYAKIIQYNAAGSVINISHWSQNASSASNKGAALVSRANVGDYFIAYTDAAVNNTNLTNFNISCSKTSDNVMQTWQDGRGTYKSLTYTDVNNLSGNQGLGNFTAGSVEYMIGADGLLHYKGKLTVGGGAGVSAVEARIPYPNGYIAAGTDKIPSIQLASILAYSALEVSTNTILVSPNVGYFNIGQASAGAPNSLTARTGSQLFSNGNVISFNFTVPVQGVSSTPTVLALPVSKENNFTSFISGSTFSKVGAPWISSVVASGTNSYIKTVAINSGVFSLAPNCQCNANEVPSASDATCRFDSANSTNTSLIFSTTVNGSASNQNITISCQKRDADYTPQGVVPVNITPDTFVQTSGTVGIKLASAEVSSTGAVSGELSDFINGSCTNANPRVCTFNTGFFTSRVNCQCTPFKAGVSAHSTCNIDAYSGVTSVSVKTIYNGSANADAFFLSCHGY